MAEKKMRTPSCSMIEVDKVFFNFVAGDKHNPVIEVAYENLREMVARIRSQGYVVDVQLVLHDIEAEDKEDYVSLHSEKLSLTFGMSRLHLENVIRIVNNFRICKDFHVMYKFVSSIYGREILVRDRSRFHVFNHEPSFSRAIKPCRRKLI